MLKQTSKRLKDQKYLFDGFNKITIFQLLSRETKKEKRESNSKIKFE